MKPRACMTKSDKMANLQDPDERREFLEKVHRSPWWVDLLCVLGLIAVIGGSLAECSGAFDEPPPKCIAP